MASLLRLLVVCFTALLSLGAHAFIPSSALWSYNSGDKNSNAIYSSADAACGAYLNARKAGSSFTWSIKSLTMLSSIKGNCLLSVVTSPGATPQDDLGTVNAQSNVCPANSTAVSGNCTCRPGYSEDPTKTSCVAPLAGTLAEFCLSHSVAKNTFRQSGTIGSTSPLPPASCYKPDPPFSGNDAPRGCQMTMGDAIAVPRGDGLLKDWSGVGVMTGAVCEDATATDAAPKAKDDPCPGGFPGTVNGETRCIASEPDKGIEGVKTSSSTAANGTKTDVKEVTKCEGANCTTTTTSTSTTAAGAVSSNTTSVTGSLSDKCSKDPKNDVCKKTQGGNGSAISDMSCDINPSAVGCGGDGAAIGDLYAKKDKTVAQALTKAKDALQASPLGSSVAGFFNVSSGGSCPQTSANIPFLNKTIVIDAWCTNFAANMFGIVRAVLLMLASWMAFRIAIDN